MVLQPHILRPFLFASLQCPGCDLVFAPPSLLQPGTHHLYEKGQQRGTGEEEFLEGLIQHLGSVLVPDDAAVGVEEETVQEEVEQLLRVRVEAKLHQEQQ